MLSLSGLTFQFLHHSDSNAELDILPQIKQLSSTSSANTVEANALKGLALDHLAPIAVRLLQDAAGAAAAKDDVETLPDVCQGSFFSHESEHDTESWDALQIIACGDLPGLDKLGKAKLAVLSHLAKTEKSMASEVRALSLTQIM